MRIDKERGCIQVKAADLQKNCFKGLIWGICYGHTLVVVQDLFLWNVVNSVFKVLVMFLLAQLAFLMVPLAPLITHLLSSPFGAVSAPDSIVSAP